MTRPRLSEPELRACLERHERALLLHARSILGDAERARDVVQETMLQWLRGGPSESDPGCAAWLFRVCRNAALDVLRKERRMSSLDDLALAERAATEPPPEAALDHAERRRMLKELLALLSEKQREALRLKFQAELSYREIAEVMGVTVNHVGVLLHEALRKLRACTSGRAAKELLS
ncbi:MAG: sigma-70 family RNA polymerase sigma factor [Planctomycetes bacterium]|nr:sigma-70 family RNA polymerase sigma factor [Planctomycetota bacterium]